jgi:hypothetical protein
MARPREYTVREVQEGFYVVEYDKVEMRWGFWPVRVRLTVGTHDTRREAYEAILEGRYDEQT